MIHQPSPARVDALIADDPYLTFLGLAAIEHDGIAGVVLPPRESHVGIPDTDTVHGGVIAAFLEATAWLHLRGAGADAVRAVEFTTDFLRAVRRAPTVAVAQVLRSGRRFASVRVEAWQDDRHRLVAIGHGRFVIDLVP